MKYRKLTGIVITSIIMLLVLSVSVMGQGAEDSVQNVSDNLSDNHLRIESNRALSIASAWAPPVPAYKVVVAPDAGHPEEEHIFGDLDGIYQLDYSYLLAAGLPVDTLDPRSFRMFYMGEEIDILVEGETDGSFDAGTPGVTPDDAILFYGMGVDSMFDQGLLPTNKYTDSNIYWLTYGGANGARMAITDGSVTGSDMESFLHTERQETSNWYFSNLPFEHDADHWYWDWIQLIGAAPASKEYDFTINHLASTAEPGSLSVSMVGYTDGQHHLKLYVNDNLVFDDDSSWVDFDVFEASADFPHTVFIEGINTIKVEVVSVPGKFIDKVYVNWIKVSYYDSLKAESDILKFGNGQAGAASYSVSEFASNDIQVYDVSDDRNVKVFENLSISTSGTPYTVDFGDTASGTSQYIALSRDSRLTPSDIQEVTRPVSLYTPADLLDTANEADYIVITHANFWDEAYRLADFRENRYRVALVDVQQIYDQFNGGLMSAESIHDFLEYAHLNWTQPQPMFVVLLGDGTSDMRNYDKDTGTFIPPYLYLADFDLGETAVQNRFVTLIGDDILPDMHIGRLPANDLAEAQAMVDKIIRYEVSCKCNDWNYNTLFIADDKDGGGGDFAEYSNRVADGYVDAPANTIKYVPDPPYSVQKVYFRETCDVSLPEGDDSVECRAEVADYLNNEGALFVSWVGHSTKTFWAVENIVDIPLINELDNAPCLPVSLAMTCFEGSFHDPSKTALAEHAVRVADNGFIASWSPTGFGLASGHDKMELGLMLAMFHYDIFEIGAAITSAKEHLVAETGDQYEDLVETFLLLGDPAVMPKTDAVCSQIPTAVRLESYQLQAKPDALHITWRTAEETNILGFNVLRRTAAQSNDGPTQSFESINPQILVAQWSGLGVGAEYSFVDSSVIPGVSYDYKLEIINVDGSITQYDLGTAYTLSSAEISIQPKR